MANKHAPYAPISSLHHQTFLRGTKLKPDEVVQVRRDVDARPDDVDARLLLLGHSVIERDGSSDEHLLWLIEHHPDIDLGTSWPAPSLQMCDRARSLWARAMERGTLDVLANAATSMIGADSDFAESALNAGMRVEATAPATWFHRMAEIFEWKAAAGTGEMGKEQARFATVVAELYLSAAQFEKERTLQLYRLWSARQAAKAAGHPSHRLLELADREGNRARRVGLDTVGGRHAMHTASGLLAIAAGDLIAAEEELKLAINVLPDDGTTSPLLAKELLTFGPNAVASEYLSRMSQ